jgi:IS1 family transposase
MFFPSHLSGEWLHKLKMYIYFYQDNWRDSHSFTLGCPRWNDILRQRLARFVRMTLPFSRVAGHATPACLLFFLHRDTTERAILLT